MVLISLIISFSLFAHNQDNIYLGQKDFGHYYGAFSPEVVGIKPLNNIFIKGQDYSSFYLTQFISRDLFFEKRVIFKDLLSYSTCSNEELSIGKEYFRYAHRLLALSYIYEASTRYDYTQKRLGLRNTCKTNLDKVIASCRPKTRDMKSFISNLNIYSKYEKKKYVDASYSIKKFKNNFLSLNSKQNNLLKFRLKNRSSDLTLKQDIDKVCKEESDLFSLVCNEDDSLYGMSNVYESYSLLSKSNVFNYFLNKINITGCLKRYKKEMSYVQKKYGALTDVFPFLYQELKGRSNNTGAVFKLGTLREFTEQGLSLYKTKIGIEKPKVKKVTPVVVKKIVKAKVIEKRIEAIATEAAKEKVKPKKKELAKLKISEFLKSKNYLFKNKLSSLVLNMDEFKYDYLISLSLKTRLEKRMTKFFSRSSLEEMKKIDAFGSKTSPLPLIFLKYMIDYNKHKELFTFIDVVGDTIYFKNDIDKKDTNPISKIHIENNFKTKFKWQITLMNN